MVIYLFTFPNSKHYIGRTVDYNQRLAEHKYGTQHNKTQVVYKALRKYGWDNVTKQILEECSTKEELIQREAYYIEKYNSVKNGYNSTENTRIGGDNWEGLYHTEKYKAFQNTMQKINSGCNNGMYGKTHKEDSKERMKLQAQGRHTLKWFILKYGEEEGTAQYKTRCANKSKKSLGANNPSYKKIDLAAFEVDVLKGVTKKELCEKYKLVSTGFTNKLKECFGQTSLYKIRGRIH